MSRQIYILNTQFNSFTLQITIIIILNMFALIFLISRWAVFYNESLIIFQILRVKLFLSFLFLLLFLIMVYTLQFPGGLPVKLAGWDHRTTLISTVLHLSSSTPVPHHGVWAFPWLSDLLVCTEPHGGLYAECEALEQNGREEGELDELGDNRDLKSEVLRQVEKFPSLMYG